MFEDLRAAFRQAIENFNRELHRDQVPDTVDRLLRGMQRELVDAKAAISELERQVERARGEAAHEKEQAEVCRRREEMARRIDDAETADLAARYAERHTQRRALLERIKEARIEREGLTASTGRSRARDTLSEAGDLFSELDRMAEKIEGERHAADAAEELEGIDLDAPSDFHVDLETPAPEPPDVDAALAELKRRMGKNG